MSELIMFDNAFPVARQVPLIELDDKLVLFQHRAQSRRRHPGWLVMNIRGLLLMPAAEVVHLAIELGHREDSLGKANCDITWLDKLARIFHFFLNRVQLRCYSHVTQTHTQWGLCLHLDNGLPKPLLT